jgi:LysM repeat protein
VRDGKPKGRLTTETRRTQRGRLENLRALCVSVVSLLLFLSGCGYVRVRVTAPPPTVTATAPVRLLTPDLGGTSTPAPSTPLPTATATATATPIVHVVQEGDNLLALSYEYDVSLEALIEANGIENPRILSIGQRLIIPREEGSRLAAEPTATPTPMPLDVINLAFYRTPVGSLWCMGEVLNKRDESLEVVQLRVTLYDDAGQRVGETSGFTAVDVVPADIGSGQAGHGRAPFALLFADPPPSGFASYEVVILGAEPIVYWGTRHRDLIVEQIQWETDQGMVIVRGTVRNAGDEAATDVEVTITAYGKDGTVAGVRQTEVEALAAGEQSPFVLSLIPAAPAVRIEAVAWGLKAPTSNGSGSSPAEKP